MKRLNLNKPKGAIISDCEQYRYALWRCWDQSKGIVMFLMLNPSTANANEDDPTLRRCETYCRSWGYGGFFKANLFAYRSTDPKNLLKAKDPIGPETDKFLKKMMDKSTIVIAAWGNHGILLGRNDEIKKKFKDLYYLKMNGTGEPAHPLYLKKDLKPKKWK